MDRVNFATRKYEHFLSKYRGDRFAEHARYFTAWVRDEVCAAVHDYWRRPTFRDEAAWPLRNLAAGAQTKERALVERVDTAFVRHAQSLIVASRDDSLWAAVMRNNPPVPVVVEETIEINGNSPPRQISLRREPADLVAAERLRVESIAGRFWTDLVCPDDFFYPLADWMYRQPPAERIRSATFVPLFNPRLHPIGDCVTRCLLCRVEDLVLDLHDLRRRISKATRNLCESRPSQMQDIQATCAELDVAVGELKAALEFGDRSSLRDSCAILAQVYTALHPDPDCDWLGLRGEVVASARDRYARAFSDPSGPEIFDRVAVALGDLAKLYPDARPGAAAVDEAIATDGLVLTGEPAVYWEGRRCQTEWAKYPKAWRFLWLLATRHARSAAVEEADLYRDDALPSQSAMARSASRLRDLLPMSVRKFLQPGPKPRSYRLTLPAGRVHVFAEEPGDR
jgi:hypothetical protein